MAQHLSKKVQFDLKQHSETIDTFSSSSESFDEFKLKLNSSILSHSDYECDHSFHHQCHVTDLNEDHYKGRFLIRPNDSIKFKWDTLIMVGAIFNCFCIPVELAYSPDSMKSTNFMIINAVIDFFFVLDIIVSFRTTYIDHRGQEVFDQWRIAKKYLKLVFWIDLATVIPFDQMSGSSSSDFN